MYVHKSAPYRLDAIDSRHAAKQKQMTGFFFFSPPALCLLVRGCTGCVACCRSLCHSLVGAFVVLQGCGPCRLKSNIFDMNTHTMHACMYVCTALIALMHTVYFFTQIYMLKLIKIERKLI